MRNIPFLVLVLFVFCCVGCDNDNDTNSSDQGNTMPARAGSVYIYNNTPIDTSGKLLTDFAYLTVDSVAATGTTFGGKSNVSLILVRNLKSGLITPYYINFESNGDISEYAGGSILSFFGIKYPDWVTYPMQSHTASGFKIADTTFSFPVQVLGNVPIHVLVIDSITYVNQNMFSLNSTSISVFNLKHRTNFSGTANVIFAVPLFNSDGITTVAFAPSIGYYTDKTTLPFKIPLGILPSLNGLEKILVSYNLK